MKNIKKRDRERDPIEKFGIATDNIHLSANGIKKFCLDKMENRELLGRTVRMLQKGK